MLVSIILTLFLFLTWKRNTDETFPSLYFLTIVGSVMDNNVKRVQELLQTRMEVGYKKYGVTTERTDLTTEEWLQHLQEELLDAAVYIQVLKGKLNEIKRLPGLV